MFVLFYSILFCLWPCGLAQAHYFLFVEIL